MGKVGNVTNEMNATRICSHGKITSLATEFSLPGDVPFSLYVRPKAATDETDVVIPCKLYQDDAASDCPFGFKYWTEPAVKEVSANASLLTDYDVYWGAGDYVEET